MESCTRGGGGHRDADRDEVFGGYGLMEEYPVARFYRDAKVLDSGEGTSEVQRVLVGRSLGLPSSAPPP